MIYLTAQSLTRVGSEFVVTSIPKFDTYIIGVSGGKDSTALWCWARENLPLDQVRIVHNPTGASWPGNDEYLAMLEHQLDVTIERVRSGDYPLPLLHNDKRREDWYSAPTLYEMIRLRGFWPSARARYCTKYLKQYPIRLYAKTEHYNVVLITDERAQESKSRSLLQERDNDETFAGHKVLKCPRWRPILNWSSADVLAMIKRHGLPVNPVYRFAPRVGCWCCPLGSNHQALNFCRQYPQDARRWVELEREINHHWKYRKSLESIWREANTQMIMPGFERKTNVFR